MWSDWSRCMTEKSYTDFGSFENMIRQFQVKVLTVVADPSSGSPTPDVSTAGPGGLEGTSADSDPSNEIGDDPGGSDLLLIGELRSDEVDLAVAAVECLEPHESTYKAILDDAVG